MRIAVRADASEDIGTGHVMRCLALAEELRRQGADCVFVCRELPGHLAARIAEQGFALNLLPLVEPYRPPSSDTDYGGWAQVAEESDAAEFVAAAGVPDVIIVDHYGFGLRWEQAVRAAIPARLLAIDDLCRSHYAHYLLDQNFGRAAADYAISAVQQPPADILVGPRYALLRAEFREARAELHRPAVAPVAHRLLVTLGGIDKHNVTGAVITALETADLKWLTEVVVLLPESAPHYKSVAALLNGNPRYRLLGAARHMAAVMASATLCVGAAGGTTWERAAMGLPSVLVPVADNQRSAAEQLAAADIALLLPVHDIDAQLRERLNEARQGWPALVHASLQLCDARGAVRVANRLLRDASAS